MIYIPPDVCGNIFLRLPAKDVIRFRAVCKSWRVVIDDPCFVKAYTDMQLSSNTLVIRNSTAGPPLYSFDLDALDFDDEARQTISATPLGLTPSGLTRIPVLPVAACNGLFLVRGEIWEIWNPLTDERLELPNGNFVSRVQDWGLGYDSASDDYKAVVIHKLPEEYPTYVYSLKSDSWRKAMNCPCDDLWFSQSGTGVYLSGALHWMSQKKVFALDLGTEKYRQWRLPPFQESHGDEELVLGYYHLDVLGGLLMVSDYGMDDYGFKHYDVWVMNDYGVEEDSWVKLISMSPSYMSYLHGIGCDLKRPVACLKNKTQIFMQGHYRFFLFDIKSLSVKVVSIDGLTGKSYTQIFHGSIFRLHDNCGVSGRVKTQRTSMSKISDHTELYFYVRKQKSEEEYYRLPDSCDSEDND